MVSGPLTMDPGLRTPTNQTLITSVNSFTAAADFLSAASSSGVSLIWMICSTPRAPSFTGTPTNRSRTPYSPCRNTEHGRIFFLSLRIVSTISAAAEPGVRLYQQAVDYFGLGYEVKDEREVTLPGYDGPVRLGYAEAVPQ